MSPTAPPSEAPASSSPPTPVYKPYPRCGGTITVRFGPPIPVEGAAGGPGRRALTECLRAALLELGVPDGLPPRRLGVQSRDQSVPESTSGPLPPKRS